MFNKRKKLEAENNQLKLEIAALRAENVILHKFSADVDDRLKVIENILNPPVVEKLETNAKGSRKKKNA